MSHIHLERAIEALRKKLLELGTMAEETLHQAFESFRNQDEMAANKIIASDTIINEREVEVEEDCLKTLALYQPVAADLRFIVAILKINNDLERIGDLGKKIAHQSKRLRGQRVAALDKKLDGIYELARPMLKKSLDAFVLSRASIAREVCRADVQVDELYRETFELGANSIRSNPDIIESVFCYMTVARSLERVGDLSTNIAEDVMYFTEGEIVRHKDSSTGIVEN